MLRHFFWWPALCIGTAGMLAQPPQATLHITVESTGVPVAGAALRINNSLFTTNRNGEVSTPVPLGKIEIKASKEGYLPQSTTIDVTESRDWQVSVELHPQEEVEEQITVHATRTDTRLQDLPTRVEVLDQEEIDEKTVMTPGNIVMMLNEMGGLRVQTTSPSLGAASVRIQGMRGRYTQFLTDGLPLFGQQGGGLGLLQVPPMDLGQVEVIKGVSSALYGAGAMAGVVNLISRRPVGEPVHELLVNRSALGSTDVSLFDSQQISDHWGFSVLGGGYWQERNDRNDDGWADLAAYSRGSLKPRLFWDNGTGESAFLTGGFTYENRQGGTMPGSVLQLTGQPYLEALMTHRYDLGGDYQFVIHKRFVVTARGAASSQQHHHQFGEILERDRHDLLFGEITIRGSSGRHAWIGGLAAEREAYRPEDVPRFEYTYVTPGLFAQDDIVITPWLSLSASGRVDFQNQYGTFFSPRLSALLRWNGWTSRLSAGQGFFAPTPLTEETEAAGLYRLAVPASLVAERGRSASFDIGRSHGALSYNATLFASTIDRPVYVDRTDTYRIVNLAGPARNLGVELLGTWRKAPLSITANYNYVHSTEPELGPRVDTPLTPHQSFGITGTWEGHGWRLGGESYYTGRQRLEDNPYRSESKPYVLSGFLIERKLGAALLFLNAENLADVRQTNWDPLLRSSRSVDGRWTVDAWAPLDGRVFNGGVKLKF